MLLLPFEEFATKETRLPGMIVHGEPRQGRSCGWSGRDGRVEELRLDAVEFLFEMHDVELVILVLEACLDDVGDRRMCQDAMVRSHGRVIAACEATAAADFLDEFHRWLEEVDVEP